MAEELDSLVNNVHNLDFWTKLDSKLATPAFDKGERLRARTSQTVKANV